MIGEYSCPFLCNTRKACGNASTRPEGCRFYWKAKKHIPCSDCGKPTASACGRCPLHVRGYVIMLSDTMIDFDEKKVILANPMLANSMIDFDQRYKKKVMRK